MRSLNVETFEKIMAWARYLYWSDLSRKRFEDWAQEAPDIKDRVQEHLFFALSSQWCASLWVVIEGWMELDLDDKTINELLKNSKKHLELLKRYRNGVYHFQSKIIEPRFEEFLRESQATVPWVHFLHHEFLRFFWNFIHDMPGLDLQREMRDVVTDMIGWFPQDTLEARQWNLTQLCEKARSLVEASGDPSSDHAKDLMGSLVVAERISETTQNSYNLWRDELLVLIKNQNREIK